MVFLQFKMMNSNYPISHFTFIIARGVANTNLSRQYDSLITLAKQCNLSNVIVRENSITSTQQGYNQLIEKLIDCVYQN
jgi:hypothetical protein